VSRAQGISALLRMGESNARVFLEGLNQMLGKQGTRQLLESVAPPRSPLQDAMRQQGGIRMGVRELPQTPRRAPEPEFTGPAPRPEPVEVPMPSARPMGSRPEYTVRRGDPTARQDVPPAPSAAEPFEAGNQLRIPFTQPGRGGQMYSPSRSSQSAEAVAGSMRQSVGDVSDAPDFPRFRGSEGQRALDLEPSVTREMMQQMSPGVSRAPQVPSPMALPQTMRSAGVNQVDLSNPMVRAAIFSAGIGALSPLMMQGQDPAVPTPMDSGADLPESIEEGAATGSVAATGETDPIRLEVQQFVEQQPMGPEAAAVDESISRATTAMQQSPGEAGARARAMAPRDPSSYSNIADYYADRKRFVDAMKGGEFTEKMKGAVAEATPSMSEADIAAFVASNPTLAYELMMRGQSQRPNPMMSEQTGESITTQTVGSALGDDNLANATGQALAAAANVSTEQMEGTLEGAAQAQQNNEIIDAARPILRPQLQRTEEFVDEQFRPRMAGSTGFFRQMGQ